MFRHPLIALQDVATGLVGLELARKLSSPGTAPALLRVHGGYRIVASSVNASRMDAERHLAESDLKRVAKLTGLTDMMEIGSRVAAEGLAEAIAQRGPDLLVLDAAQVLAPSDPLVAALGNLPVAIAVTSPTVGAGRGPLERIGVAVDGSTEGERALAAARRVAGALGVTLYGLTIDNRSGLGGNSAAHRAAEELIEFSRDVDLLVVGPRPTRPLRRLLGPGTVEALIASTAAPLLLVPAGATLPSQGPAPVREQFVDPSGRAVLR